MKQVLIILLGFSILVSSCNSTESKSAETILCENALAEFVGDREYSIVSINKVQETTHLQWCLEQYTELRLRQMLCMEDYQLAKLNNNKAQMKTATTNAQMFQNDIEKIIAEQDTATNSYLYEKVYEITYNTEYGNETIQFSFLDGKLQ